MVMFLIPKLRLAGFAVLVVVATVFWWYLLAYSSTFLPTRDGSWSMGWLPTTTTTTDEYEYNYDVCCVGAGLSGAVIAERYASVLGKKVLVMEKRDHIGGNCYDYIDKETGILVNKYGAHLFHTNHEEVWEYINQFSDWKPYEHRVVGYVKGKHVPIPVNIDTVNSLFQLRIETPQEMSFWLQKEVHTAQRDPGKDWTNHQAPKNSEEMAISRVGERLFHLIYRPYTLKQWAKEPSQLGPEVASRIPVRDNFDDRYFGDKYQALPSQGYTQFFQRLLHHPLIRVKLGTDYFHIRSKLKCGKTFFTGPIDDYFAQLGWAKLEYRSLDFERRVEYNKRYKLPLGVVNYPSEEFNYTRIVEYKHFLNQTSPHTVFFYEHSRDDGEPYYPVPNEKNKALYKRYQIMAAKESNVTFVGRLANYKYFNMDEAILNALHVFQSSEQGVYKPPKAMPPKYEFNRPLPSRTFPAPQRRVLIDGSHGWYASGGPEALIQLALAFRNFLPPEKVYFLHNVDGIHPELINARFLTEYSDYEPGKIPYISPDNVTAGDIIITAEIGPCKGDLVRKGTTVYKWQLARRWDGELMDDKNNGCKFIAHNYFLSNNNVFGQLPPEAVLRPFISPSLAVNESNLDKKENLVLIDDDNPGDIKEKIKSHCLELNCTSTIVSGFSRSELPELFGRAKIVIDWSMVGSERMPLESILRGAILITSPNLCGAEYRDYPIPRRNIVDDPGEPLKAAMKRILTNHEQEYRDNEEFRSLYLGLNLTTLTWEAKNFYYSLADGAGEQQQQRS